MLHNKKAQVAETAIWLVATLIIIVMIFVSAFLASVLGGTNSLMGMKTSKVFYQPNQVDLFAKQSLTSYLLTKDSSGITVYQQIINDNSKLSSGTGALNDFDGNLASSIFKNLYSGYYNYHVFLGIIDSTKNPGNCAMINNYFDNGVIARCATAGSATSLVYYLVKLNNEKSVKLILWR